MHMTKAKPVGASHPGDELLYLFAFYGTFWLHLNICLMNRRPVDQDLDGAELLTQTQNMVARMPEVVERSIEHLWAACKEVKKSPNPVSINNLALAGDALYKVMDCCSNAVDNLRNILGHTDVRTEIETYKSCLNWIIEQTQTMRSHVYSEYGMGSRAVSFIDLLKDFDEVMDADQLFHESVLRFVCAWRYAAT